MLVYMEMHSHIFLTRLSFSSFGGYLHSGTLDQPLVFLSSVGAAGRYVFLNRRPKPCVKLITPQTAEIHSAEKTANKHPKQQA
jgi:hypothetical protein